VIPFLAGAATVVAFAPAGVYPLVFITFAYVVRAISGKYCRYR